MLAASLLLLVSCEAAPTPEYAKAKAAYQAAFADTADVTYKGPRWDEVLTLLKAVPPSNAKEHRLAQQLVTDIESTRARLAADLRASNENADRLLDIKSLPPLEPQAKPTKFEATEEQKLAQARQCVDACAASFQACMKSVGCVPDKSTKNDQHTNISFDCPRNEASKVSACNNDVNACSNKCSR
jgi:hypothetical protein